METVETKATETTKAIEETKKKPVKKYDIKLKDHVLEVDTYLIETVNFKIKEVEGSHKMVYFPLREITLEELSSYRRSKVPSFVLKEQDKFFYAKVPFYLNFYTSNIVGVHKCAQVGTMCQRLSPAPDRLGGCAKVRSNSTGIEKFPWIRLGYESFNTAHDVFGVVRCQHYVPTEKKAPLPVHECIRRKRNLRDFLEG